MILIDLRSSAWIFIACVLGVVRFKSFRSEQFAHSGRLDKVALHVSKDVWRAGGESKL